MNVEDMVDGQWYTLELQGGQTLSGSGKELKGYVKWAEITLKEKEDLWIWGPIKKH